MEEIATKLVNLGLGVVAEVKSKAEQLTEQVNKEIVLLTSKGEADQSEEAVRLREVASENAIKLSRVIGGADDFVQEFKTRFGK